MNSMRVALYLRVSTSEQKTELQSVDLLNYAKTRNFLVTHTYEDKLTGTNNARPALQALLRAAKERKFDAVLVWKLDRFARSMKDLINHLNELHELGIEFISLKDQIDFSTSTGKLMLHIVGAFAQFEADLIKERVKAGIAHAKLKGTKLGRPRLSDPIQISKLRAQGLSLSAIAKRLGISKTSVHKTLSEYSFQNPFMNPEIIASGSSVTKD